MTFSTFRKSFFLGCAAFGVLLMSPASASEGIKDAVQRDLPLLLSIYRQLHAHPELSGEEVQSAATMAKQLRSIGFDVHEKIGGHGLVGVMRNGPGPVVAIRADMDALPILEETGLPFASRRRVVGVDGVEVPVMHACGHDMHMVNLLGTARRLAAMKAEWKGTLLLYLQPAEETLQGARAMLADGLYTRFPRPDFLLATHVSPSAPAGSIGYASGRAMAAMAGIDLHVRGTGGHGATPEKTRDPVVLSAQIIMALQSVISREVAANDAAVITVGRVDIGRKRNVIAEDGKLDLSVRAHDDKTLATIVRRVNEVAIHTARAFGMPEDRLPRTEIVEQSPAVVNDGKMTELIVADWTMRFGAQRVRRIDPVLASEDFAFLGRGEPAVPSFLFFLGTRNMDEFLALRRGEGVAEQELHSSTFRPDAAPALLTGIEAMTGAALTLFSQS
ncbi:MAG: amidohydrolase [Sphingopyxis sp.]|uniref:amidohydrolase n=1 Tax=Sphingopyxis sp. TaxID=1908224 RepID=UPI002ABBDBA8|nr:amidohydrolase [Sphingopyxis sp.]MDZ3833626.1 amidohydrolase [Sphingopyxis sp.]